MADAHLTSEHHTLAVHSLLAAGEETDKDHWGRLFKMRGRLASTQTNDVAQTSKGAANGKVAVRTRYSRQKAGGPTIQTLPDISDAGVLHSLPCLLATSANSSSVVMQT